MNFKLLYVVNFKFHPDTFRNQKHTLIIDMPNYIENTKVISEKEGLIQTIIEKQINQRIDLIKYEPVTEEHTL